MTFRTLRIITVAVLSHLLLAAPAFTSELPLVPEVVPGLPASQEVTIEARQQSKQGSVYSLDGDVEVTFRNYVLRAGHASYNEATGEVEASGGVVFEGGPHEAHLTASRVTYNVKTETGTFYEVAGTFGAVVHGRSVVLTTSNPFVIAGAEVEKVGPNRYIVRHGSITSCAEPTPKWTLGASKIDVVPGEDAKFYHSNFRLFRIPLLYLPYGQLPAVANARFSGFLLPVAGQSSTKGFILGESVYWAINRSNDLTLGSEFYSRRGWSQRVHFRSRPSANSSIDLRYFGVLDRGAPDTHQDQGGREVWLVAEARKKDWHVSVDIDYLDSFLFRQAFSDSYSQAVNSEVKSVVFLSRNRDGISLNASAERYQNFYEDPLVANQYNQTRISHLPTAEMNVLEHRLGPTPLRWSVDAVAGGLHRSDPGFVTANVVGRLDVRPVMALPIHAAGWQLRPEVALHETLYTQRLSPSAGTTLGAPIGENVNRQAVEAAFEIRPPVLAKVFRREVLGRRLKHVIEPVFTYRYTNGVDNFPSIIRFDQADILSDTSEFEYELTQRLYGRRRATNHDVGCDGYQQQPAAGQTDVLPPSYIPGMSALPPRCEDEGDVARELVSWQVRQKYYVNRDFGGALVAGRRNVLASTAALSGIAFLDGPRSWSPVVSRLRIQTSANTDVQWQLDYDPSRGKILSSATFLEYRLRDYFVGLSHSFFRELANTTTSTTQDFDQVRYVAGYGHPNKRGFSGGFSMGHDQNRDFMQYVAAQSSYNWDCCGVSFEYRHLNVPGVNEENQYRFAFSLANIGTFGNLRRQERLY